MKRAFAVAVVSLFVAGSAFAQSKENQKSYQGQSSSQTRGTGGAGGMDMKKMGPWSRKPTDEKKVKKEIEEFYKQEEAMMKKGDFDGMLARIDFPVFMLTDDSKGMPQAKEVNQQEYVQMMRPMHENMPKDMQTTHKPTVTVLSDSLATVVDDFTMTMGKEKMNGRSSCQLVKRDGEWKWKVMTEAGWGDMAKGMGGAGEGGQRGGMGTGTGGSGFRGSQGHSTDGGMKH